MKHEKYNEVLHAYIIYEVIKCQESLRNMDLIPGCKGADCTVDPECASTPQIKDWVDKKRIQFTYIQNKVNLARDNGDDV